MNIEKIKQELKKNFNEMIKILTNLKTLYTNKDDLYSIHLEIIKLESLHIYINNTYGIEETAGYLYDILSV